MTGADVRDAVLRSASTDPCGPLLVDMIEDAFDRTGGSWELVAFNARHVAAANQPSDTATAAAFVAGFLSGFGAAVLEQLAEEIT